MTDLPANVSVCGVKGHFAYARLQAGDADGKQDLVPVVGLVVTLTPSVTYLKNATATPPVIIVPEPLVLTTDINGDLRDVDGNSTAYVIATDDDDLNPTDWTYTVSFTGPGSTAFRAYSAAFPGGQTLDLALLTPTPTALGISVSVAQAAEAAAAAYATAAAASAALADGKLTIAATVTAASALTINSSITAVTTTGYAANGDGGGATYKKVGSQPSHAGKFQSADGAWWELLPEINGFNVKALGATGNGTTSDVTAFDNAVALCNLLGDVSATANKPLGIMIPGGTYNLKAGGIRALVVSNVSVKVDPWAVFILRDGPIWTLGNSSTIIENFSVEGGQPRTATTDAFGSLGANCCLVYAVNAARIYIDKQRFMRCQIFKAVSNLSLSTIYIRDCTGSGLPDRHWIDIDNSASSGAGAAGLFIINCGGYAYVPPANPTFHPHVITAATQANPVVVTSAAHGFVTGAKVRHGGVVGMTQLNGNDYTITRIDANSYSLDGVDGTGFTAYASGGWGAELLWTHAYGDTAVVGIKGHWDTVVIDGGLYQHWPWLWNLDAYGPISFVFDEEVTWDFGGSGRFRFTMNGGSISSVKVNGGWNFTFNDDYVKTTSPGSGFITDLTIRGHILGMSGKSFIDDSSLDKIINLEVDGLRVMGCGRARVGTSYLIYPGNTGNNVTTIRNVRMESAGGYFSNPTLMRPDVGIKMGQALRWTVTDCEIDALTTNYDIGASTSSAAGQRLIRNNKCRTTGVIPEYLTTGSATPPTSDTATTNHTGLNQHIFLSGGTMTAVKRNGTTVMSGAGPFSIVVPPHQTWSVTYSVAPTMVVSYAD